jgi:hypothetical protein
MANYDPGGLAVLNDEYLADINENLYALPIDHYVVRGGYHIMERDKVWTLGSLDELYSLPDDHPIWSFSDTHLDWLWNESVFDRLNEIAPNWCYFGAHEGDGAAIGFWLSWESLHEDLAEYPWSLHLVRLFSRFRIRRQWILDTITRSWGDYDAVAAFLESLEHEVIPDMTIAQLSRKYAAFLVRRWLS